MEAGFYTITVTDNNNCSQSKSITIAESLAITFQTEKSDVTSCASNGSIRINATGGSSPYSYSIDGGATWQSDNSFSNLLQGNYSLQVKDANECETVTSTVLITDNGSDAYENNNSLGAAKMISLESTYLARLGNQGDTDWFKYNNPKSPKSEGTYYLIFDPQADGQTAELYEANGSLITPIETGSLEGSLGTYVSYYLFARESYHIKVSGATSLLCYTIRLSSSLNSAFRISNNQVTETHIAEIKASSSEVKLEEKYDAVAYPNPSNGLFRLALPGFENGDVKLRIVDGIGRLIFNEIGLVVNGKMLEEATLTDVAKGVYYVQVIQGGRAKTIRVIFK